MKLREFLNYRTNCLSCGSKLNTLFHSGKRQSHSIVNDRLLIKIDLKSLKKGQKHYKVGYSIDCDTNDFCIEFFDQTGLKCFEKESPLFLIDRFKKLDKNQGSYNITVFCNFCDKYWYRSNSFDLDYKTVNFGELSIHSEYGCFVKQLDDEYKLYKLHSYYDKEESSFDIIKYSKYIYETADIDFKVENNMIKTHLIQFKESPHDIIEKLNILMVFS
jgi:hypothetical protein